MLGLNISPLSTFASPTWFYFSSKYLTMKPFKVFIILFCLGLLFTACENDDFAIPDQSNPWDPLVEERSSLPDIIQLPDGFQPEGIVIGKKHTAYIGSIFSGAIWKANLKTGNGEYLVHPGTGSPNVGLSFDKRTSFIFAAAGYTGGMKVYDAKNGALVAYYQLTPPGPFGTTWINDLIVTRKAVYITDSFRPFFYKVPLGKQGQLPDQSAIEEIPLTGDWVQETVPIFGEVAFNANGIDATPNGKILIVVNYNAGLIYKVNPKTGHSDLVETDSAPLFFADGIVLNALDNDEDDDGDDDEGDDHDGFFLYVVQNTNTLTKILMDEDLETGMIVNTEVDPNFQSPSTLDDKGRNLYVVNARFDVASPFFPAPNVSFNVVRIPK